MAKQKYQKVRFTGKRTGMESIAIPGVGIINQGDSITVNEDIANRWLAIERVDDDGKSTVDWTPSGNASTLSDEEFAEISGKERERITARAAGAADESDEVDGAPLAEDFAPEADEADQGDSAEK